MVDAMLILTVETVSQLMVDLIPLLNLTIAPLNLRTAIITRKFKPTMEVLEVSVEILTPLNLKTAQLNPLTAIITRKSSLKMVEDLALVSEVPHTPLNQTTALPALLLNIITARCKEVMEVPVDLLMPLSLTIAQLNLPTAITTRRFWPKMEAMEVSMALEVLLTLLNLMTAPLALPQRNITARSKEAMKPEDLHMPLNLTTALPAQPQRTPTAK